MASGLVDLENTRVPSNREGILSQNDVVVTYVVKELLGGQI